MTPATAVTRLPSIVRLRRPAKGPARAPVAQPHILVSVQLFTFQAAADAGTGWSRVGEFAAKGRSDITPRKNPVKHAAEISADWSPRTDRHGARARTPQIAPWPLHSERGSPPPQLPAAEAHFHAWTRLTACQSAPRRPAGPSVGPPGPAESCRDDRGGRPPAPGLGRVRRPGQGGLDGLAAGTPTGRGQPRPTGGRAWRRRVSDYAASAIVPATPSRVT